MSAPLRLLHVISSLDPQTGGPSEGLRQLGLAQARLGLSCDILVLDAPDAPWLSGFPATVHALGPARMGFQIAPALTGWLQRELARFDGVIVHGLWQLPGRAVRQAARRAQVPYFVFTHGMLDPWFKTAHPLKHLKKSLYWMLAERAVLKDAAAVLFTTDEEARLAGQTFALEAMRSSVVGYGIAPPAHLSDTQRQTFFAQWPSCQDKRLILFLSRIHPKKGADLLLEAFAAQAQRDPFLHLVMAGPDEVGLRARLEARAALLGLAERITWTGMLSGDAKWGALQAADVFALTSHQENFGVAVVEALAVGLPVLITHAINIAGVIAAAGAGLVESDTEEGAKRLLAEWLALDASGRARMRAAAKACFEAHFHIDRTVHALQRLVREARHGSAGAAARAPLSDVSL